MKRRSILLLLAFLMSLAQSLQGQPTTRPATYVLTLHPVVPADPALKYRLLPSMGEQTPGNAATLYLNAFSIVQSNIDSWTRTRSDELDELLDQTPDAIDAAKAKSFDFPNTFELLRIAANRSYCNWDPSLNEQGYQALLPYLNYARLTANLLSLQIKVDIKEGRFDDAVDLLRTGFALADNLDREPIVIECLVAAAIRETLLGDVRVLIQRPGAPNLYWPLANLHASADLWNRITQSERDELFNTFRQLRHPEELSAEQARKVIDGISTYLQVTGHVSESGWASPRALLILQMIRGYPRAKAWMIGRGVPAEQVEAMPANALLLAWYVDGYGQQADAIEKWTGLPPWQALPGMRRDFETIRRNDDGLNPLRQLLPALGRAYLNLSLPDRQRAMLQTIEAIRGFAAAHGGAAPDSLEALSPDTPAPVDPLMGKPFGYSVQNGIATLRATAPAGGSERSEIIYRIEIAR